MEKTLLRRPKKFQLMPLKKANPEKDAMVRKNWDNTERKETPRDYLWRILVRRNTIMCITPLLRSNVLFITPKNY